MSKKHKKRRIQLSRKTMVIIAVGGGVAIISAVVIVLLVIINQSQPSAEDAGLSEDQIAQRDKAVKRSQRDVAVQREADEALQKGDVEAADKVYGAAIDSETDVVRKMQLSVEQSRLLYRAGKVDEAIAVAKEAEKLSSDKFYISDWLARMYEDQKKYAEAKQYFTAAREQVDQPSNVYKFKKAHYDMQIARVEALEKR